MKSLFYIVKVDEYILKWLWYIKYVRIIQSYDFYRNAWDKRSELEGLDCGL